MICNTKDLVDGEDCNAQQRLYGYPLDSGKRKAVHGAMTNAPLELLKDTDVPTRIAKHKKQRNTTSELTWIIPNWERKA